MRMCFGIATFLLIGGTALFLGNMPLLFAGNVVTLWLVAV